MSNTVTVVPVIGFVGLGVMGGPMCRNVALKHGGDVIAFDMNGAAFASLDGTKARRAATLQEVAELADVVFLSLPGGRQVEQVCLGADGLASGSRRGCDRMSRAAAASRIERVMTNSVGRRPHPLHTEDPISGWHDARGVRAVGFPGPSGRLGADPPG
jgi:pyrroline-5-carboxylate reductase